MSPNIIEPSSLAGGNFHVRGHIALGYELARERLRSPLVHLAPRTTRLSDTTTGYYVRPGRLDDCWQAALATCLQVPIGDVPDTRIDERLRAGEEPGEISRSWAEELPGWLTARGLRIVEHTRRLPVERPRWIGVVPFAGMFNDHCLVMSRGEVLFNPTGDSGLFRAFGPRDVKWGYSFRTIKEN